MSTKAEPLSYRQQPSMQPPYEQQCPHCQQANRCAIAAGQPAADCWCMSTPIDPELAERYRDQQRCLCQRCGSPGEKIS